MVMWENALKNGLNKICERQPIKIWRGLFCLKQNIPLKFSKGCLPQFLLGQFLNTSSHIFLLWDNPNNSIGLYKIFCNNVVFWMLVQSLAPCVSYTSFFSTQYIFCFLSWYSPRSRTPILALFELTILSWFPGFWKEHFFLKYLKILISQFSLSNDITRGTYSIWYPIASVSLKGFIRIWRQKTASTVLNRSLKFKVSSMQLVHSNNLLLLQFDDTSELFLERSQTSTI